MQEGLRRLYAGECNFIRQEWQADGSVLITVSSDGDSKAYRVRVRDLCGPNEEVLEEEVIETGAPQFIQDRMTEARKQREGEA